MSKRTDTKSDTTKGRKEAERPATAAPRLAVALGQENRSAIEEAGGGVMSSAAGADGTPIGLASAPFESKGPFFLESLLAAFTGVSMEAFADVRQKIARGTGWDFIDGKVAYKKDGALLALLALGLATETPENTMVSLIEDTLEDILHAATYQPAPKPAGEPKKEAETEKAVVVRYPPNPKAMWCKRLNTLARGPQGPGAKDDLVLVFVTDRKNFKVGMEVPIEAVPKRDYFECKKTPSKPGKW